VKAIFEVKKNSFSQAFEKGLMKKINKKSKEEIDALRIIELENMHETIKFRGQMLEIMKD
jgi:hypothetical protein